MATFGRVTEMAKCRGLENRWSETAREFESPLFRHFIQQRNEYEKDFDGVDDGGNSFRVLMEKL